MRDMVGRIAGQEVEKCPGGGPTGECQVSPGNLAAGPQGEAGPNLQGWRGKASQERGNVQSVPGAWERRGAHGTQKEKEPDSAGL